MEYLFNTSSLFCALIGTFFTCFVTILGASIALFVKNVKKEIFNLLEGMCCGVMIASSFFSLLIPSINQSEKIYTPILGFILGCIYIMITDIIISKYKKIESDDKKNMLLVTSVTVHNAPEGMSIGVAFGLAFLTRDIDLLYSSIVLSIGIGIQNFPEGLIVSVPLTNKMNRLKAFMYGILSGIVEIIFGVIGVLFVSFSNNLLPLLLSFASGAMIYVCFSEIATNSFRENKIYSGIGLIIGFSIMTFLDVFLG